MNNTLNATAPNATERGLRIRQAVRGLIVTPDHDVLLVRFEFPGGTVWAFPGGGLEPGEDHLAALHRELFEEVGMRQVRVGPVVWIREHLWPHLDGNWDGQCDRFHLVEVDSAFTPAPAMSWEELRAERLHEIRWWSYDEIQAAAEQDDISFAPRQLPTLLADLRANGVPPTPILTGR